MTKSERTKIKIERMRVRHRLYVSAMNAQSKAVKLHLAGIDELEFASRLRRVGMYAEAMIILAASKRFRILSRDAGKFLP